MPIKFNFEFKKFKKIINFFSYECLLLKLIKKSLDHLKTLRKNSNIVMGKDSDLCNCN